MIWCDNCSGWDRFAGGGMVWYVRSREGIWILRYMHMGNRGIISESEIDNLPPGIYSFYPYAPLFYFPLLAPISRKIRVAAVRSVVSVVEDFIADWRTGWNQASQPSLLRGLYYTIDWTRRWDGMIWTCGGLVLDCGGWYDMLWPRRDYILLYYWLDPGRDGMVSWDCGGRYEIAGILWMGLRGMLWYDMICPGVGAISSLLGSWFIGHRWVAWHRVNSFNGVYIGSLL